MVVPSDGSNTKQSIESITNVSLILNKSPRDVSIHPNAYILTRRVFGLLPKSQVAIKANRYSIYTHALRPKCYKLPRIHPVCKKQNRCLVFVVNPDISSLPICPGYTYIHNAPLIHVSPCNRTEHVYIGAHLVF